MITLKCLFGRIIVSLLTAVYVFTDTLFCNFYFTAAKFGLLDVLHTEVIAAVSVDLGFVPRGGLIIGAVSVGCSCETESTKGDYCWGGK